MIEQFNGSIKYVDPFKRYGFITPSCAGAPDIFFSFDQLRGHASRIPRIGEKVIFEKGMSRRGPVCLTVYNMADPLAEEDYERDIETAKRLEAHKLAAQAGQKAFREALYERNRQWRAAHTPSAHKDVSS